MTDATGRLPLKGDISIRQVVVVGGIEFPPELFLVPKDEDQPLRLREPWQIDSGLVLPRGEQELHYRISSRDPKQKKCFFIPATLFLSSRPAL